MSDFLNKRISIDGRQMLSMLVSPIKRIKIFLSKKLMAGVDTPETIAYKDLPDQIVVTGKLYHTVQHRSEAILGTSCKTNCDFLHTISLLDMWTYMYSCIKSED